MFGWFAGLRVAKPSIQQLETFPTAQSPAQAPTASASASASAASMQAAQSPVAADASSDFDSNSASPLSPMTPGPIIYMCESSDDDTDDGNN